MARPKTQLDFNELDAMLQFGPTLRFCADHFGVGVSTIERKIKELHNLTFAEYKDEKMDKVRLKLQQKAIQMALKGDRVMLIFCLKNLCKWADKIDSNEDINIKSTIVIASDEQDL